MVFVLSDVSIYGPPPPIEYSKKHHPLRHPEQTTYFSTSMSISVKSFPGSPSVRGKGSPFLFLSICDNSIIFWYSFFFRAPFDT